MTGCNFSNIEAIYTKENQAEERANIHQRRDYVMDKIIKKNLINDSSNNSINQITISYVLGHIDTDIGTRPCHMPGGVIWLAWKTNC